MKTGGWGTSYSYIRQTTIPISGYNPPGTKESALAHHALEHPFSMMPLTDVTIDF